ncbi:MAG: sulfatase [Polyangiaceae bacterium]
MRKSWCILAGLVSTASCARTPAAELSPNPSASQSAVKISAVASGDASTAAVNSPSAGSVQAAVAPVLPKNLDVILITIDCLRADMPWAGYERAIAPRLTAFAEKSVQYTHEYSLSSYTSMSLGGLLAGKLPGELTRDGYFFGTYGKDNLFFPEVLQAAGIHTMAGHAHGYFKSANLNQGFDDWQLVPDLKWNNTTDENITSPQLEKIAEGELPKDDSKRFFAWFHFLDPHDRYLPHEGISYGKSLRDKYDAEVTFTDQYIGKLFDFIAAQPYAAHTAIIVTADHGEAFGEHHQFGHGFELWQNLINVPLLISVPGIAPNKIDEPRSAIDIAPTIVDLFGVKIPPHFEGHSLVPELLGAKPEARDIVIDLPATSDNDKRRALIHGKYKLISSGSATPFRAVYDLEADPDEAKLIHDDNAAELLKRYKEMESGVKDVPATKCKEDCLNGAYAKKKYPPQ